jgi:hypothetical protein
MGGLRSNTCELHVGSDFLYFQAHSRMTVYPKHRTTLVLRLPDPLYAICSRLRGPQSYSGISAVRKFMSLEKVKSCYPFRCHALRWEQDTLEWHEDP